MAVATKSWVDSEPSPYASLSVRVEKKLPGGPVREPSSWMLNTVVPAGPLQFTVRVVPLVVCLQASSSPMKVKLAFPPHFSSKRKLPVVRAVLWLPC
jgi:hypothetical protein